MSYPYFDRTGRAHWLEIGNPADMLLYSELWEFEYRRVALTRVGAVEVSTVFLPIDHSHTWWPRDEGEQPPPGYRPQIFETMVFGGELDQEQYRYSTEEEALEGHARVVSLVELQQALNDVPTQADPSELLPDA